jgi:hypothetical protein
VAFGFFGDNESADYIIFRFTDLRLVCLLTDSGWRPVVRPTILMDVQHHLMLCSLLPPDLVRWGGQARGRRLRVCCALRSWSRKKQDSKPRRDLAGVGRLGRRRPPAGGLCRVIFCVPSCVRVHERWSCRGWMDGCLGPEAAFSWASLHWDGLARAAWDGTVALWLSPPAADLGPGHEVPWWTGLDWIGLGWA